MNFLWKSSVLGMIAGGLAACGGSDGGTTTPQSGGQTVTPAPPSSLAPSPAPAPSVSPEQTHVPDSPSVPGEERLVLPDNTLYAPGDYFAYAAPWCTAYDPSLVVGQNITNTISLLRSTFPNDVVITADTPDHYPTVSKCGVYGYNAVTFGHYLTVNTAARMQPRQVKDIGTLAMSFDMTLGGGGEYNILAESFLTAAEKDFSTKIEIGFYTHSTARAVSFAKNSATIGAYVDNAGRNWSVTKAGTFVMFVHDGGKDLTAGTLDVRGAFSFLMARGVLTGDEWFNGISLGMEPLRGKGVATIHTWSVSYS